MTVSAQRQARAELRWWRANRDAKHVFSEELRAARQVLAHNPKLEIYGYFEGSSRTALAAPEDALPCLLSRDRAGGPRSHVAIWGAARGVEPRLG